MSSFNIVHVLRCIRKTPLAFLTAIALMSGFSYIILSTLIVDSSTSTAKDLAKEPLPNLAMTLPASLTQGQQTVVFAGGCFWGMEAVFEHLKGVSKVVSGFAGGSADTAHYETVSTGETGHAESVQITYDPSQISYGQLLQVFFSVAHDPTQFNRQGPDVGTQYRSAIFFANPEQKQIAQTYIQQLKQAHIFPKPIVTQLTPLQRFYAAEDYHQNFIDNHPDHPYVVVHDLPKLNRLKQQFTNLYH